MVLFMAKTAPQSGCGSHPLATQKILPPYFSFFNVLGCVQRFGVKVKGNASKM